MKKSIRKIVVIGFIIFLLMQLYQPARNSDNGQVLPAHITRLYSMPTEVQTILQTSCFDCHSNNTNYPWYSYIQPARFFMEEHIKDGKKDLNFSEFGNYSKRKQESKLKAMGKQIKSDEMPLSSYTLIHKNAILTTTEKEELINWINEVNSGKH
jgi:hypothetical protein